MEGAAGHYADYYRDEIRHWRALGAADKAANVVRAWPRSPGPGRIVDIGCGEGSLIKHLAQLGFGDEFHGLEVSPSALTMARELSYARPVSFASFDGRRVPAADQEFDLAILSHVLEHVQEPRSLLLEARRVARFVFVEVPLELNLRTPSHFTWSDVGHINLFSPLVLRHLCESSGLEIVAERVSCPSRRVLAFESGWKGSLKWALKRSALAAPRAASRVFTYHGAVLARPTAGNGPLHESHA
jgi:SAM-dependent methyltransferase